MNNQYYQDIVIDQTNLDALPVNGLIDIPIIEMDHDTSNEGVGEACGPSNAAVLPLDNLAMPHSFISNQLPTRHEREAIQVAIESDQVIQWPE